MRRFAAALIASIAPACLLAACSLTSLQPLQEGSGGRGGDDAPASTTDVAASGSTSSATSASGGGAGGSGAGGSGAGGGAGGSGAGGSGSSTGGGGSGGVDPGPPDLIDTGLLVRYFLDEASEGTAPTHLTDADSPPLDLSIDYAPGMEFTAEDGHVGLSWAVAESQGIADEPVAGTKIETLDQSVYGTIETVIRIEQAATAGSRILHVGTGAESSFTLAVAPGSAKGSVAPPTDLELRVRIRPSGEYLFSYFDADFDAGRIVVHAVFDTREDLPEDRLRIYQDGVRLPEIAVNPVRPGADESLLIEAGEILSIGNRLIGDRSPQGTIFYAAMYLAALSNEEIAHNVEALTERDDR